MGEIAEMMLSGILCESCGSYIEDGEEPGHPRKCDDCMQEEKPKDRKPRRYRSHSL
jgi:NMD protein affecting ribosome stability and mRNA decay